jgi:hypothetical protein
MSRSRFFQSIIDNRAMMEYITYAHILNGQVFQIGDFGAVALWYLHNLINLTF